MQVYIKISKNFSKGETMKYDEININKYNDIDLIRIANYCENEFGNYGQYDCNTNEGVKDMADIFEWNHIEIIDLLYKNKNIKENDEFIYSNGRSLESLSKKDFQELVQNLINQNYCNGELQEIIQDAFPKDTR